MVRVREGVPAWVRLQPPMTAVSSPRGHSAPDPRFGAREPDETGEAP